MPLFSATTSNMEMVGCDRVLYDHRDCDDELGGYPKMKKPKHPGKSVAQRRVLDEIGCGNSSPLAAKSTIRALVDSGLLYEIEPSKESIFIVRQYKMPERIHIQWCEAVMTDVE